MDPFAVLGATASIIQIVDAVHKLSSGILDFIDHIKEFSEELRRLKLTLQSFRVKLEVLGLALVDLANEKWLTPGLLNDFKLGLSEVQTDVESIANIFKNYSITQQGSISLQKKMFYHLRDQRTLIKCLKHLESSEKNLQRIESTIHTYMTKLVHREVCIKPTTNQQSLVVLKLPKIVNRATRSRSSLLQSTSFLRDYGFYCWHVIEEKEAGTHSKSVLCFGVCLPSWLMPTSVCLAVTLTTTRLRNELNVKWGLRMQNRVSLKTPLMKACQTGDVALIEYVLNEKQGSVHDRSTCRGYTPLLVAIHGRHFEAVKYLLEHGADPNISDDDQVTPLFAVTGMNPHAHPSLEQLPPTWNLWFDTFRLLVQHGAEVHDSVRGRSLVSLTIESESQPSRTLEFLRLLAADDSLQLDIMSDCDDWPAVHNALVCDSTAVHALQVLHASGVTLSQVTGSGESALHISAWLSASSEALEYLYTNGCSAHINRQDQWGWTPLHYAVASCDPTKAPNSQKPYSKVVMLLQNGADPNLRSSQNAIQIYRPSADCFTAFEYLQQVRPARFRLLAEKLINSGLTVDVEQNEDVFYDLE